jgi:CheY-like chemotaxis protein/anti-sigma regulatory factor (Ser/Thr protein kinase)
MSEPAEVTILVVDDSAVDRLVARRLLEKHGGWRVAQAADGADALEAIAKSAPSAVLTDLQMPRVGGLALVEQVRERFPKVPVILMTGHGSEEIAISALQAGAASYVPKRNLSTDLIPTVEQILAVSQTDDRRSRVLGALAERTSRFVLESDPGLVSPLVQMFREELTAFGLCDPTGATRAGIALEEALLNAVYHGNLGVSSELKLSGDGSFERLAAQRQKESPYRERRVRVRAELTAGAATFVVEDDGPGFDVSALPDPTDPANLERPSGRGLLFMRTFMDEVQYNQTGNCVTLIKRREVRPEHHAEPEPVVATGSPAA